MSEVCPKCPKLELLPAKFWYEDSGASSKWGNNFFEKKFEDTVEPNMLEHVSPVIRLMHERGPEEFRRSIAAALEGTRIAKERYPHLFLDDDEKVSLDSLPDDINDRREGPIC